MPKRSDGSRPIVADRRQFIMPESGHRRRCIRGPFRDVMVRLVKIMILVFDGYRSGHV